MPAPKNNTHAQKGDTPRPGHIHTRATAQAIADLKWLAAETGQSQGDVLANLLASERLRIENTQESAEVAERLQDYDEMELDPIYEASSSHQC